MSNLYECPTPVSGYGEIDMPNVLDTVYKDNYHLVAIINGHRRWFVSRKGTENGQMISKIGSSRITEEVIKNMTDMVFKDYRSLYFSINGDPFATQQRNPHSNLL